MRIKTQVEYLLNVSLSIGHTKIISLKLDFLFLEAYKLDTIRLSHLKLLNDE